MAKTTLWIARHGQVVGHDVIKFNGHNDVDLTDHALLQMRWIAGELRGEPVAAVYSSDLRRASRGAAMIAEALGAPHVERPALRELCHGELDGVSLADARRTHPDLWDRFLADPEGFRFPGGESFADLRARVLPEIARIRAAHPGQEALVLTHLGPCRVVLADVLGLGGGSLLRLQLDYGSLSRVEYDAEEPTLTLMNKHAESPLRALDAAGSAA